MNGPRPDASAAAEGLGSRSVRSAVRVLIRGYQLTISPVLGPRCRFWPSCSDYALQAVQTHGPARGLVLGARRLLRCHPWCEGGFDPVPPTGPTAVQREIRGNCRQSSDSSVRRGLSDALRDGS